MAHAWQRIPETNTVEERIQALENDTGNTGSAYNACVARKYLAQGKKVDVSLRFKCADAGCNAYQEVDMEVDGQLKECKSGTTGSSKHQFLNYGEISQVLYGNTPVTALCQVAATATREAPHLARWAASKGGTGTAVHEPCP